jgi:protein SCO1/2
MSIRRPLLAALAAVSAALTLLAARPRAEARPAQTEGFSIYELDATWHDQRGAARTLADLRGRPQVVAMIYTHCAATCPLTVANMKRVDAAARGKVGLVLVSLDPQRDTAGRLAAYAAEHGLDAARWTLLRGSDDAVRDLAAALGVRYRRATPDELAHTNTLTVLDARGVVVHQTAALGDVASTLDAVRRLVH